MIGRPGGTVSPSSANNLIGTVSGGLFPGGNGNHIGVINPRLGPLADNGGPTQTIALLPGSPAINAGSNCAGRRFPGQPSDHRSARRRVPPDRGRDRGHRGIRGPCSLQLSQRAAQARNQPQLRRLGHRLRSRRQPRPPASRRSTSTPRPTAGPGRSGRPSRPPTRRPPSPARATRPMPSTASPTTWPATPRSKRRRSRPAPICPT